MVACSELPFMVLLQANEAAGGSCTALVSGAAGISGPFIPSNLDKDELAWVSKEVTFSPVWVAPPTSAATDCSGALNPNSNSGTDSTVVIGGLTATACYDVVGKKLRVTASMKVRRWLAW